ncbi:MAG: hypothetical protein EXR92_02385 [Gemmatimonadetes bacterium]|nr:hypothetical protein [Gemmatimonadota bacterium]
MSDSVVVDAKRILLRYGVPIRVLDKIGEKERISFARAVSRTPVPDRSDCLRRLLVESGYMKPDPDADKKRKGKKKARKANYLTGEST